MAYGYTPTCLGLRGWGFRGLGFRVSGPLRLGAFSTQEEGKDVVTHDVGSGGRAVLPDIDEQYSTQALPVYVLATNRVWTGLFLLPAGSKVRPRHPKYSLRAYLDPKSS